MKANVQIRLAEPDESEAIAKVIYEAFAEFENFYTPEAFAYTTPDAEKIRTRFDAGAIWAATENGKMVGTVSVAAEGERLYIRSMAILPSAQGLGIGREFLETIENFARENGFGKLFLYTLPCLSIAARLYEKNGFARAAETSADDFFGMPGWMMEKKLF